MRPAGSVTVDGLEIDASNIWLDGRRSQSGAVPSRSAGYSITVTNELAVKAVSDADWPDHVLIEGVHMADFLVGGADYVTIRNSDAGPLTVDGSNGSCRGGENKVGANGDSTHEARHVTIDGVLIHNQNRTEAGGANGCHTGGFFLVSGSDIQIRNSVFSQNVVYNIQVQNFGGRGAPHDVTIENNWFGCPVQNLYDAGGTGANLCDGQADIQFNAASTFSNWLIRYNSFGGGIGQYVDGAGYSNVRVVGNAGGSPRSCLPGVVYAYNAWQAGQLCSKLDIHIGASPFVSASPGKEDMTLVPGTKARGLVAGTGADYELTDDIAGRLRPIRKPRDAGASQREDASIVLGRSIGAATIGAGREQLEAVYGKPRRVHAGHLGNAKQDVRIESYRVPGGFLKVISHDGTIVGLTTSSSYYSTRSGLGAGAATNGRTIVEGARWVDCLKAYRRLSGGVAVHLLSTTRRQAITGVEMYRRAFEPQCAPKPKPKS